LKLLREVSEKENWTPWIKFFLDVIYKQTRKTLESIEKIEELHGRLKEKMPEINSIYANPFLDAIFIRPVFSAESIRKVSKISNTQTLYTIIKKFIKSGIISYLTLERMRNKIYIFLDLRRIIK